MVVHKQFVHFRGIIGIYCSFCGMQSNEQSLIVLCVLGKIDSTFDSNLQ